MFSVSKGLMLQGLTTAEPTDDMIEVAIASVEAVFDWKEFIAHMDDEQEKPVADEETAEEAQEKEEEKRKRVRYRQRRAERT